MSEAISQSRFIIPPVIDEISSVVHSSCYRLALSILSRTSLEPAAVKIDNMHYTALIFEEKICFADNSKTIFHADRPAHPVTMEWQFLIAEDRDANDQHIPMIIRFHETNLFGLQQQLTGEFYKAMMDTDEAYSRGMIPSEQYEIITLSTQQSDH